MEVMELLFTGWTAYTLARRFFSAFPGLPWGTCLFLLSTLSAGEGSASWNHDDFQVACWESGEISKAHALLTFQSNIDRCHPFDRSPVKPAYTFYKNGAQNPLVWNSQWDVSDKRYDKLTL